MKKIKKSIVSMLVLAIVVSAFSVFGTTSVSAAELNEDKSIEVVTNYQWDQFENELNQIKNTHAKSKGVNDEPALTKEQFFELVEKYDGAERTVYENRAASYSKSGTVELRDDYGLCATLLITDGKQSAIKIVMDVMI